MTQPPFRRRSFRPKRKTGSCRPDSLQGSRLRIDIDDTPSGERNQEEFRLVTGFRHDSGPAAQGPGKTVAWMHHAPDCPDVMNACLGRVRHRSCRYVKGGIRIECSTHFVFTDHFGHVKLPQLNKRDRLQISAFFLLRTIHFFFLFQHMHRMNVVAQGGSSCGFCGNAVA